MSSVRRRNVKNDTKINQKNKNSEESFVERFKDNILSAVCLGNNKNIQRIEGASVVKPILLFIAVLSCSVYFIKYLHSLHDDTIAGHLDEYTRLFVQVPCSNDYGKQFPKCSPKKCGRSIRDNLFDKEKLLRLRSVAEKGLAYGGGSGGASILDLHSGAVSYKDKFINLYRLEKNIFTQDDFDLYAEIKNTVLHTIANEFQVDARDLFLTSPTFFSRLDSRPAITGHDEYWHPHIDRVTYGTFFYTSLLYLSTYNEDFTGGRFTFVDSPCNKTVEPRFGRLSFFTSGSENEHFVEQVQSGTRFAMTISFTCDKKHGIADPSLKK